MQLFPEVRRQRAKTIIQGHMGKFRTVQGTEKLQIIQGKLRPLRISQCLRRMPGPVIFNDRRLPRGGTVLQLLPP